VREVPHGLFEEFVDAADTYPEKYKRAFVCGIEKVENLPQEDGITLSTWSPATIHQRTGAIILSDDELRKFAPAERQEIGSVIYTHSFLPRRMPATYLLPSSLQEPLTSQAVRLAVASQSYAAPSSEPRLEPSTPHQAETETINARQGASSAGHTVASAAAAASP
jgi:hypothetical protein